MKTNYILPILSFLSAILIVVVYPTAQTIDINIHDTYYVIPQSSFFYFVWLLYIPITVIYLLLRKHASMTLGLLHLLFQTLALLSLIKTSQSIEEGLPRHYSINTEEPWLDFPRIILMFSVGLLCFFANVIIGIIRTYRTK